MDRINNSPAKRVSPAVAARIKAIADSEHRTFIDQLDLVVDAGLRSMGYAGLELEER